MRGTTGQFIFVPMEDTMKNRYRKFRRDWGVYYAYDTVTGNSQSLKTKDKHAAERLTNALNEGEHDVGMRKQLGLLYLSKSDPEMARRTWHIVMETAVRLAPERSKHRWESAVKDPAFKLLRRLPLLHTRSEHFLQVLAQGTVSTNVYLRRLQNLALDLRWIVEAVLNKRLFPKPIYRKKRAITLEEHRRIVERELNAERRDYYELIWHTGGAQTDMARLVAENINWTDRVLSYHRVKNGQLAQLRFGKELEAILHRLPTSGPLFPYLRTVREADRATEFRQRCDGLEIKGVTLHSYRYSWAQRAKTAGYPQRYAQQALGHASKAVAEAYAADAQFVLPSLEEFEAGRGARKTANVRLVTTQANGATQEHGVDHPTDILTSRIHLN